MYAEFCDIYSPKTERKRGFKTVTIKQKIETTPKEDKFRTIKLVRINPNGDYGTYVLEQGLAKEQLEQIENILGVTLKDYKMK